MKIANCFALTLVVIGALNWGLIGFFGYDIVTSIFGGNLFWVSRVIFGLVGLSGLWALTFYPAILQENQNLRMARNKE